jgi:NADPH:quinone reductase-like Zn-dependent oxidoreductase
MKVLRFGKFGPPSVLRIEEVARPEPRDDEVLVQVKAAAINPSGVKNVAGQFHSTLPRTPGRDFAGVVVAGKKIQGRADVEQRTRVWRHARWEPRGIRLRFPAIRTNPLQPSHRSLH